MITNSLDHPIYRPGEAECRASYEIIMFYMTDLAALGCLSLYMTLATFLEFIILGIF